MKLISFSCSDDILAILDAGVKAHHWATISDAVRTLLRDGISDNQAKHKLTFLEKNDEKKTENPI